MVKFVPVSRQLHSSKSWVRPINYDFAARDAICPLAGLEIPAAATSYSIAFIRGKAAYQPVAVFSHNVGTNLYLSPNGSWIPGRYVPSVIRAYPFRLLPTPNKSSMMLCVDESSGLVRDTNQGEPFFDEAGKVAETVASITAFLEAAARSNVSAGLALKSLAAAEVIVPWDNGGSAGQAMGNLYRVDEQRLRALDDAAFSSLRSHNALAIAYAQLISMSNMELLPQLASARQKASQAASGDTLSRILDGYAEQTLRFD